MARAHGHEIGAELAVGERLVDEICWNSLEQVELAIEEREPYSLPLLDDRDLNATGEREPLSDERSRDRHGLRRHRFRGHIRCVAEAGIGQQHDLRAALVLAEHVRPGADGVRAKIASVGLHDLTRNGGGVGHGEHI